MRQNFEGQPSAVQKRVTEALELPTKGPLELVYKGCGPSGLFPLQPKLESCRRSLVKLRAV